MSERKEVLNCFNSISSRFAEKISVYCVLDLNEALGISYFELNRASHELAQYFVKIFEENQYIGVSLSEYFLLPSIILGIWKSGNCFAGVGTQYTKENILEFLKFLRIKYLITDKNENQFGGKLISQFSIFNQIFYIWFQKTEKDELVSLQNFSYAIMTSGTTGEPKIIQVPWSCITPNAVELSSEFQVTELDCIFQASPCSFDPFFIELLMTFLNGSSLMIVLNSIKLNPSTLLKILFEEPPESDASMITSDVSKCKNHFHLEVQKVIRKNVTILQMTPSVFLRWSNDEIKNIILAQNTQLRVLILGGEKFPNEIMKLRSPQNTTRIFNIYGITEISCWAFLNEITDITSESNISIGKPLNNILYRINENGSFEIGSRERICLINEEKVIESEHPVYRKTGDIVKSSNEKIYYISRSDEVVKKFGIKINLSEIENCFLKENESIKECFCIFNQESKKLALYYVPDKSDSSEIKRISFEEFQKLNYKIPFEHLKSVERPDYIFEIPETPVNSHGKCDKKKLLQYLKKIERTKRPKESLERIFERLWVEILHKRVNNASFMELGGNSVLGLNLINKLEEEGVTVPQNFITILLGGKSYDNCLQCLSLAQDKIETAKEVSFYIDESVVGTSDDGASVKLSLQWRYNLEKCVDATPSLFYFEGRQLLVVGSHSSKIWCIDAHSGTEVWKVQVGGRIESEFRATLDGSKGFIGCYDHCAYGISSKDGDILWKFKTGDLIKSTPCLSSDERILYVASYDKNLYCLSASGGELLKILPLSGGGIYCSGIADSFLQKFFIGTLDGTCVSIDQISNEQIWKTTYINPIFAAPCLLSSKTHVLFAEVAGIIHCLSTLTGEQIWEIKVNGSIYSTPTAIFIEDSEHILFGCHDKNLYCYKCDEKPELKWNQILYSPIFTKPAILTDWSMVCAVTSRGVIWLLNYNDGSILLRKPLYEDVFSSPVYHNDRLFLGCRDDNVYSFHLSTTSELNNSNS